MSENTEPRNINNLSKPDTFISPRHDCFWRCWTHAKNAWKFNFQCVHGNFSRKQTVKFPNTPSKPVIFSGDWQVASLEVFWLTMVRKITEGQITVLKIVPRPKSPPPHKSPIKKFPSRRPWVVSMRVPRQFRAVKPALTFTAPEVRYIKPCCYSSIDDITEAIVKKSPRNDNEKLLPPTTQHPTDTTSRSTNIPWKVDKATHELHIKFWGNVEQNSLGIRAKSQVLKNMLGLTTVTDCQHSEQRLE